VLRNTATHEIVSVHRMGDGPLPPSGSGAA
jgi:hypothetical protein